MRPRRPAWRAICGIATAFIVAMAGDALAGQACEPAAATATEITSALDLGLRSAEALDRSGARVALIARAGQDLGAYGLQWSHLGFVYRDDEAQAWRIVHKLNHCGSDEGALYRQGLADFFMDRPWRAEAAIVVLDDALQRSLLPLLKDDRQAAALHIPRYSMVAYPWSDRYQQSNQWALETLARAADPGVRTRADAQAWLRREGFRPSSLSVPAHRRLGARLASAHIAFDDHPPAQRFAGRIDTVTVDAVFAFLRERALGETPLLVR